jgi:hypothetical protein
MRTIAAQALTIKGNIVAAKRIAATPLCIDAPAFFGLRDTLRRRTGHLNRAPSISPASGKHPNYDRSALLDDTERPQDHDVS